MINSNTPELRDLYQLGEQIERDKSASVHVLRQRDHDIGRQCDASDDAGRLLFWLRHLPDLGGAADKPGDGWLSEASAALLARAVAAVLGFSGMMTFLLASGRGLVNVFAFLLLFVVVQFVLCLFAALVMFRSVRGNAPVVLPLNPARFVVSRVFPDKRYLKECQFVLRLLLLRYGQEFGAIFTLGATAAFFVVLAFSNFTFVWGSTFDVSDQFVRGFTDLLAMPWSSWLPDATLPAQVIADSRYHPALTDLSQADVASMRGWWPFLIMALLSYALLPRMILWTLSKLFYGKSMWRALARYPGSESILVRMKSPVVRTQAQSPEEIRQTATTTVPLDDSLVLLNWAGALGTSDLWRFEEFCAVPPANVLQAGLGSLADDAQCNDKIDQYQPERLLVAVKSWEPPMADLQDFLGRIESIRRCTLYLVPLPRRCVTEHKLQEWRDFARELPLEVVDTQALGGQ